MRELKSYSIDELEELTGYDRRTVSYYSAEGLLPKVGRRGPKTRYSQEFADRLNFIRRTKELQDAGKLPSTRLQDLAEFINRLSAEQIAEASKSNPRLLELYAAEHSGAATAWSAGAASEPAALIEGSVDLEELDAGYDMFKRSAASEPHMLYSRSASRASERRAEKPARSPSLKDKLLAPIVGELKEQLDELRSATQAQAGERESMQRQLAELSGQTENEIRQLERMFEGMRELRALIEKETRLLRDTLEEFRELRELSLAGPRTGSDLSVRARAFAKRNGLDTRMLRVARLRPHPIKPKRRVWAFPVDRKLLSMGGDITVLCEGRDARFGDDEFVVLEIPAEALEAALLMPIKKQPSGRMMCELSAEDDDFLVGVNCPGLDARPYRRPVKVGGKFVR